ncbi:hypothetical protein J1792_32440 [Streptomyces triculaminicus]|uniref:Immunity protein 35 domain-containing protein n=1 Tax=Streptomyces triculaminicus TaxID=2816232 RepID=A0A939JUY2_9ACTN|nr:hypothetical protein [Streptomyces triculaminicus]MBO0657254.1 hypothetical protein [Streptomyces triculaminicus]
MLDRKEAQELAARYLDEQSRSWPSNDVRLILESCFIDGDRFIGPFNTIRFLDHDDEMERIAGNYPVCVDLKTGECGFITRAEADDFMDRGLF